MTKINVLVTSLRDLKEIFDSNGIQCWLIYGALLGYIRDKEMIPWDNDIDIGIWESSLKRIEKNKSSFKAKGFKIYFTESMHVTFSRGDIYISAMVYKKGNDKAYRSSFTMIRGMDLSVKYAKNLTEITRALKYLRWVLISPKFIGDSPRFISNSMQFFLLSISRTIPNSIRDLFKKVVETTIELGCPFYIETIPQKYFTDLMEIIFYDISINIPKDAQGYLAWQYGDDWNIPNKSRETRTKSYAWKIEKYKTQWEELV